MAEDESLLRVGELLSKERQDFLLMKENRDRWKAIAEEAVPFIKMLSNDIGVSGEDLCLLDDWMARYEEAKRDD